MIIFVFFVFFLEKVYVLVCMYILVPESTPFFRTSPTLPYLFMYTRIDSTASLLIYSSMYSNYLAPSNSSTRLSISSTPRSLASISSLSPSSRNLLSASKGPKK